MIRGASVIGTPISHSLSPALFSFLSQRVGMRGFDYQAEEIQPEALRRFVDRARERENYVGFNVTIPHKENILGLLDELTPEARSIGAVNAVRVRDKKLLGANTDVYGVTQSLATVGVELDGSTALILGAGGAARAVSYALADQGATRILILNRGRERSRRLADSMSRLFSRCEFSCLGSLAEAKPERIQLIVNATSLGMKSSDSEADRFFAPIRELSFASEALSFDLIYNPERTPFLKIAEERGLRTLGGIGMLVHQALKAWELWGFDRPPAEKLVPEISAHLRAMLRYRDLGPIYMTGLMGAGKSTVGKILAERLALPFIDLDREIEKEQGLSIPQIFDRFGEPRFRELEVAAIDRVSRLSAAVVALGGGSLQNRDTLRRIEDSGLLIYLEGNVDTLLKRIGEQASSRPLISSDSHTERKKRLEELLTARAPMYERAKIRIQTDALAPEQVVERLLEKLRTTMKGKS